MYDLSDSDCEQAVIKVIGVGGCGGNAIEFLAEAGIFGADYVYYDIEDEIVNLIASHAHSKCQVPKNVVDALGRKNKSNSATLQYWLNNINAIIDGADMIYIIAGMSGNTGAAIAPVLAKLAHNKNILTVTFAVLPFTSEIIDQTEVKQNLDNLYKHADSWVTISNQQELEHFGADATPAMVYSKINDIIRNTIKGITELITKQGMIGVDFADIKTVLSKNGEIRIFTTSFAGINRAKRATEKALYSIQLTAENTHTATGLLVNICSRGNLTIGELSEIGETVHACLGDASVLVVGVTVDEFMQDEVRMTIAATDLR